MTDGYGRNIDYVRISLTDKCNLRCRYCMPESGIKNLEHKDILSFEEIQRLVRILSQLGINRIRLTGGEPLVRRGVTDLVKILCRTEGIRELVMTSNGCLLSEYANELAEAGLSGINISLDTLNRDTFIRITGRDELINVLSGIDAAKKAGLKVKLNCVPILGTNDGEMEELTLYAREKELDLRFIELMPLGCGAGFTGISRDEILLRLERSYGKAKPLAGEDGKGPALYYSFPGYKGRIGFISPITHGFCGSCNRIRLTASGFLRLCLQYPYGADLRTPLRQGDTDDEIRQIIEAEVKEKPASHCFGEIRQDTGKMVQIGG
ncbi:MAG: GTP 3',8-cyclase MoaA [Lachnospiraceae bacterium]|nr:GTP 3',8-cyclase MoaA [Lachnospiraceae bacterium]